MKTTEEKKGMGLNKILTTDSLKFAMARFFCTRNIFNTYSLFDTVRSLLQTQCPHNITRHKAEP